MEFLHFIKKKPARLELHALEPDETWYERAYYLVLLAKELKAEVEQLRTANKQLELLAKAELPLTAEQDELLSMRDELQELRKAKTKLEKRAKRASQVNQGLIDEVEDLRNGIRRAA